ncbi:amino acid adenylation domain-containing protein [Catellatospora tritici]|uniref:amino acid adenylation domain-containing protein n=1 Tax=Catellatospora tritici TaxID=2851566 RepID=UPI001C2D362F|nr:amino acid adenylation domain-containing protein [Catellatospora tritici]MBV1850607.1 amino acid adenylation domain-containing protein [Catellatospora tritici]
MRAGSLSDLFRTSVESYADDPAVHDGRRLLTYGALHAASDLLAANLVATGVRRGDLVGLQVERSVDVVVAILGILKAGAAYLPLDQRYPEQRLRMMAADAGITVLVGDAQAARRCGLDPSRAVSPAAARPAAAAQAGPPTPVGGDDPAYVIYTSGSTGLPKGCVITHGNVLSLLEAALPLFDLNRRDRWSLFHSISFDFSVWEIWGALATGACLVVVPDECTLDAEDFVAFLAEHRVTVLSQIPSVFRSLVLAYDQSHRPDLPLRYVVFGGESVDLDVVARFTATHPHPPRMINMYGITEITVHATFKELRVGHDTGSPIGVALPHLTVELRDEDGAPVAPGEPGEIWICGPSVAAGYLNRPDLTEQRFVRVGGRRFYRSGDLARRGADGELEYLGRGDAQVKLRGFRIELGEIEAVLRAHDEVLEAAVTTTTTAGGATFLVACVRPAGARLPTDLRGHTARSLPQYMVPQRFVLVDRLPTTPSGKLDRAALPALATAV